MAEGPQQFIARVIGDLLIEADEQIYADEGDPSRKDWLQYLPAGSTAIEEVRHSRKSEMMTVRFMDRIAYPDYLFIGVPRELFHQWKRVKSAGKFYHRRIKGNFNVT